MHSLTTRMFPYFQVLPCESMFRLKGFEGGFFGAYSIVGKEGERVTLSPNV
jgi:hypothetical protein